MITHYDIGFRSGYAMFAEDGVFPVLPLQDPSHNEGHNDTQKGCCHLHNRQLLGSHLQRMTMRRATIINIIHMITFHSATMQILKTFDIFTLKLF